MSQNSKRRNGAKHSPATPVGAYKTKAAARYCSLSVPTIHRCVFDGRLRPSRQTRHLLFTIEELDRFLKDGMT